MKRSFIKYLPVLLLMNCFLYAQETQIDISKIILIPYLQAPTPNSIYICWHDSSTSITKVEYGISPLLGSSALGTFGMQNLSNPLKWHSVKLKDLLPSTEYFYRIVSGSGTSGLYSFKTLPDQNYNGKIRFLLLGDTHALNTTMPTKVITDAKKKIQKLYGDDVKNDINLVLHSGDLVMEGNVLNQWITEYFTPMSVLSPNIPFMTVAGNHENEDWNYYNYMKYDELSPFPDLYTEKFWSLTVGNTVILGLNSTVGNSSRIKQTAWIDKKLSEIENDSKIDFVIVMIHHIPYSEIWGEGMADGGSVYVRDVVLPILKKYSKVIELAYGHTHGYERGTIESDAVNSKGDFRIVCGGGGGAILDRWEYFKNTNYPEIHVSLDQYSYQIIEIDIANKNFECSMYSLGNPALPRNSELMDKWYRKENQSGPAVPTAYAPQFNGEKIIFNTSKIEGVDSLMSVRIQVASDKYFKNLVVNNLISWKDVFGVDDNFTPVDLNKGMDLTKISLNRSLFVNEKTYYYKVMYRDHNVKWSGWSNVIEFTVPYDAVDDSYSSEYELKQNSPNPFNSATRIIYTVRQNGLVTLKVYDALGREIKTLVSEEKLAGQYEVIFDGNDLNSGVYFYQIQSGGYSETKKLVLLK